MDNNFSPCQTHFQQLGLYEKSKSWLDYIFTSDDIAHLSVLTMIHRAAPTWSPTQPFSDKCIAYAREAFAIHNSFDKSKSPILFSYMNWYVSYPEQRHHTIAAEILQSPPSSSLGTSAETFLFPQGYTLSPLHPVLCLVL